MTAKNTATKAPWIDPDDAPELTDAQLAEADLYEGDKFIRRIGGRPKGSGTKELISLRLDRDILDRFREGGPGWQTRINDSLRAALEPNIRPGRRGRARQELLSELKAQILQGNAADRLPIQPEKRDSVRRRVRK